MSADEPSGRRIAIEIAVFVLLFVAAGAVFVLSRLLHDPASAERMAR